MTELELLQNILDCLKCILAILCFISGLIVAFYPHIKGLW